MALKSQGCGSLSSLAFYTTAQRGRTPIPSWGSASLSTLSSHSIGGDHYLIIPVSHRTVRPWSLSLLRRCGCQERTIIAIVSERVDTSLIFKGQSANEPNCTSPQKFGSNCWLSSIVRGRARALEYNPPLHTQGVSLERDWAENLYGLSPGV